MKALTLIQPWAFAVEHLGKPIENRTWKPPRDVIGTRIAIHAGKTFDREAWQDFLDEGDIARWAARQSLGGIGGEVPRGAITCTAVVRGWVEGEQALIAEQRQVFGFSKPITLEEARATVRSRWWAGPVGWLLEDIHPVRSPVPAKGALGLWTVSDDVAALVRERSIPRAATEVRP